MYKHSGMTIPTSGTHLGGRDGGGRDVGGPCGGGGKAINQVSSIKFDTCWRLFTTNVHYGIFFIIDRTSYRGQNYRTNTLIIVRLATLVCYLQQSCIIACLAYYSQVTATPKYTVKYSLSVKMTQNAI